MKKLFLVEICVYILEIVLTAFLRRDSIFLPLFGYFFVLIATEELDKEKEQFFFCLLSGLLYDLLVSSTPFMNTFLFSFIYFITKWLHICLRKSGIAFFFHFCIDVILYRTYTYFVLILIQYQNFSSTRYINSILSSIILNIAFVLFYKYFFLKKRGSTIIYRRNKWHYFPFVKKN